MPSRVPDTDIRVITPGGHKTLPYGWCSVSSILSLVEASSCQPWTSVRGIPRAALGPPPTKTPRPGNPGRGAFNQEGCGSGPETSGPDRVVLAEASAHGREGRAHECQEPTGGHQASLIGILRATGARRRKRLHRGDRGRIAGSRAARRGAAGAARAAGRSTTAVTRQRNGRIARPVAVTNAVRAVAIESPVIGRAGDDEFRHVVVNQRVDVGVRSAAVAADDIAADRRTAVAAVAAVIAVAARAVAGKGLTAGAARGVAGNRVRAEGVRAMAKQADAIIGLGSYDLRVAHHCAALFAQDLAPWLVFTGSHGNWTRGKWNKSEAEVFADEAVIGGVPRDRILLETQATNIGENLRFTKALLQQQGHRAAKIILATKPQTVRRAVATGTIFWPEAIITPTCPVHRFEDQPTDEHSLDDLTNEMVGDIQRIIEYPRLGYQAPQDLPAEVLVAWETLKAHGYTRHLLVFPESKSS